MASDVEAAEMEKRVEAHRAELSSSADVAFQDVQYGTSERSPQANGRPITREESLETFSCHPRET
jgi:hypothetical protein